jgi:hypothetical protein
LVVTKDNCWRNPFGITDSRGPVAKAVRRWLNMAAEEVRNADRFVVTREAVEIMTHIQESKPSSLLAGLGVCRLLHKRMWIEFTLADRLSALKELGVIDTPQINGSKINRVGFLLQATDDSMLRGHFEIVIQSLHKHATPILLPIRVYFDFSPIEDNTVVRAHKARGTFQTVDMLGEKIGRGPNYLYRNARSRDQWQAVCDFNNIFDPHYHPEISTLYGAMVQHGTKQNASRQLDQWGKICTSETRFLLGCLMMLNSRNLAVIESLSPKEINRGLPKGEPHVQIGHRRVTVRLSRVQQNRESVVGARGGDVARHKVRGHWKVRKSGVFLWRPFERGNAEKGFVFKDYVVKP